MPHSSILQWCYLNTTFWMHLQVLDQHARKGIHYHPEDLKAAVCEVATA